MYCWQTKCMHRRRLACLLFAVHSLSSSAVLLPTLSSTIKESLMALASSSTERGRMSQSETSSLTSAFRTIKVERWSP